MRKIILVILTLGLFSCGATNSEQPCGKVIKIHRPTTASAPEMYTIVVGYDTLTVSSNQRGLFIGDIICEWE